jgi:hypothetical protein
LVFCCSHFISKNSQSEAILASLGRQTSAITSLSQRSNC